MPSRTPSIKGFFRRKSNKTASNSSLSATPEESNLKQPAPATRRPRTTNPSFSPSQFANISAENPPTIHNPFASRPRSAMGGSTTDTSANPPPPSYSANPPNYTPPAPSTASGTDSQYAFLAHFDTIFLIDDSGSMSGSKWRETSAAISAIAGVCTQHDKDGIDIHFLNTPSVPAYSNITSPERVSQIFSTVRPGGGTPTGMRLHQILKPYLALLEKKGEGKLEEVKPLNVIVVTDGEAGDDVESVIKRAATKLDKLDAPGWQIGIQFFQVGRDAEATRALQELDDGLEELGVRDIVDTVPWIGESGRQGLDGNGILKVVLGAVNRRLDRKKVSLEMLRR
ncbi:uncharacterized protein KY384_006594 [Bacidia gigantensis]|uniref:uncharacterized protein n=1 Tax=Bacidia gigantensis TaxID=2732470 RepID=UPI001D04F357|nr:uncharacterized protein KY384_006594 [Bacidia gigantensis]KAG8528905.1 hypothetical protein KY384_006594 [Bacidia gigantensis]